MYDTEQMTAGRRVDLTTKLVVSFVSNNSVPAADIPRLIASLNAALIGLSSKMRAKSAGPELPTPGQIRKSIKPDALISFENGKPYKTLRRHLSSLGLTARDYRIKYGLPKDYPMTAPSYSAQRSALAYSLRLGHKLHDTAQPAVLEPETTPAMQGRKNLADLA